MPICKHDVDSRTALKGSAFTLSSAQAERLADKLYSSDPAALNCISGGLDGRLMEAGSGMLTLGRGGSPCGKLLRTLRTAPPKILIALCWSSCMHG